MPHDWAFDGIDRDYDVFKCRNCGFKVASLYEPPDPDRKVVGFHGAWLTCEEKQAENVHQS